MPHPPDSFLTAKYRNWMSLKTELHWIYEGEVPSSGGGSLPTSVRGGGELLPNCCIAWLLCEGEATFNLNQTEYTLRAGEWAILWKKPRGQHFSTDARILTIRFQIHWPDSTPLFDPDMCLIFPSAAHPAFEAAARNVLQHAAPFTPKQDYTLLAESALHLDDFLEIRIEFLRYVQAFLDVMNAYEQKPPRLGKQDDRITKALMLLNSHSLNTKLPESELARKVGLGLSRFVRLFRAEVGTTPHRYLEGLRVKRCEEMLVNTSMPLKQISHELGFSHHSDFSSWFRKINHTSPKAFRDRHHQTYDI